ncbi:MAG: ShlB/FhaC/HecB family hemolysin secretion/activation protein [Gammaproteobacteria bacterium]|nr:ShlB/FhaC/HecB family hemolysin secretion/activation protein [Gammaproteobacteria bacterium]
MRITAALPRWCCIAAVLLAPGTRGQEPPADLPVERFGEPSPARPELPRFETVPAAPVAAPATARTGPATGEPVARVRAFRVVGNTVVPSATLEAIAAQYAGREITDTELQTLRTRLTQVYAAAGYVTSRATIPDQDIDDGVITIEIVEGRLGGVEVSGARAIDTDFFARRLGPIGSGPLDIGPLNQRLRWLLQDRIVDSVQATLVPGAAWNESVLHVQVEEGRRFGGALSVGNDRSPTVGGVRGAIGARARNLFGRGDQFDLILGHTQGLRDLDASFTYPLTARGTQLFLRYANYGSELVEEPFAGLDVTTESRGLELAVTQSLLRTSTRNVTLGVGFASRQSESFLRGRPFSFSAGADDGRTDIKVARVTGQWLEQGANSVFSARLTLSIGIGALGATVHEDGRPDSRYTAGLGQLQWLRRLGPHAGLLFARLDVQLASDSLLPLEKYAIGGASTVRGYRRARFVRDAAWAGSLEYRLPVLRLAVPGLAESDADGRVQLVAFVDAGRAWNVDDPDGAAKTLYGAGPGLRWDLNRRLHAELSWGALRRHLAGAGDDLQDDGVHFLLSARQAF